VKKRRTKVFVGLSGGVDSSVSAALLVKAGYDVTGVFIKVWQPDFYECTWREDRLDAMRICAALEIPFVTLDLEKEYKRDVVDYMVREYKAGRTPNPDIMCNRHVKFGAFFNWAMNNGADFVATGHYAQIQKIRGHYTLSTAADSSKDQTYFLWTLTERELSRIMFPIGHLVKKNVRSLARSFGLPTAEKKDSQGLCFVGKVDMKEFLGHFVKNKRGRVLNEHHKTIGHHNGALFFTIGERHGFTLEQGASDRKRMYVIAKDIRANTITVSESKFRADDSARTISLTNVSFTGAPLNSKQIYSARIRYRQPCEPCTIEIGENGRGTATFKRPQVAVTPGQSLVFYENELCRGGGIIA